VSRRAFTSVGTRAGRDDLERRHRGRRGRLVVLQIHDPAERRLSYELIAKAYGI
jgi:hypothetical protein